MPCIRNFFGTAHAKGEQDSAGGLVKAAVRRACFNESNKKYFNQLVDVEAVYDFCIAELTGPPSSRAASHDARKTLNRMFFHLVEAKDVNRTDREKVKTLKGSQKLHAVRNCGSVPNKIEVRERSCYGPCCFPGNEVANAECSNKGFVDSWVEKELTVEVRAQGEKDDQNEDTDDDEDVDDEDDEQRLCDAVNEGEVFAINATTQENGERFTLILATSRVKTLDQDNANWDLVKGEEVIEGIMLECAEDHDEYSFRADEKAVVMCRSYEVACHPVHLSKTRLRAGGIIYSLDAEERSRVLTAVEDNNGCHL